MVLRRNWMAICRNNKRSPKKKKKKVITRNEVYFSIKFRRSPEKKKGKQKVFIKIAVPFSLKYRRSLIKKIKKKVFTGFGVSFQPLRQRFDKKVSPEKSLRGGKSRPGEPPHFPRLCLCFWRFHKCRIFFLNQLLIYDYFRFYDIVHKFHLASDQKLFHQHAKMSLAIPKLQFI